MNNDTERLAALEYFIRHGAALTYHETDPCPFHLDGSWNYHFANRDFYGLMDDLIGVKKEMDNKKIS